MSEGAGEEEEGPRRADRRSEPDERADAAAPPSTLARLVDALELLASAHASRARDEAARDLARIALGAALFALAALLAAAALGLSDVAAALLLRERLGWSLAEALGAVAGGNLALALGLGLLARARLATPVMVETRATLKRAATVLRG